VILIVSLNPTSGFYSPMLASNEETFFLILTSWACSKVIDS